MILASSSPRRYELLRQIGLPFDVVPSRVTEDFGEKETPRGHVIRLAEAKALDVGAWNTDRWVIGADTIVCINDVIFGKPKTPGESMEMLRCLSGQEHRVFSGFSVQHVGKGQGTNGAVETVVKMKNLTAEEMSWYLKTGEPSDKAGGYAIQGMGAFMIESIRGSYTNVIGLPMYELFQTLIRSGAISISESGIQVLE